MFMIPALLLLLQGPSVPGPTGYLQAHPWNAVRQGPMLTVMPLDNAGGSEHFEYLPVAAGTVTAIAPTERVEIDADLNQPANLFVGIPRRDKVMYLASLLNMQQGQLAALAALVCPTWIRLSKRFFAPSCLQVLPIERGR